MKYKMANYPEIKGNSLEEVFNNMRELVEVSAEHQFEFSDATGFHIVHEDGSELSIPEKIDLLRIFQQEIIWKLG